MSEKRYVMIEVEWLRENVDTVCCPEWFASDTTAIAPCDKDNCGDMQCFDCWVNHNEEIRILTPAHVRAVKEATE